MIRRFLLVALLAAFPLCASAQVAVWPIFNPGSWTTYTPTLTCASGTLTSATASGRYNAVGKTVFIELTITVTTNGTCATAIRATFPSGLAPAADNRYVLSGISTLNGNMLYGLAIPSSSFFNIKKYENSYPAADSAVLVLTGVYEAS